MVPLTGSVLLWHLLWRSVFDERLWVRLASAAFLFIYFFIMHHLNTSMLTININKMNKYVAATVLKWLRSCLKISKGTGQDKTKLVRTVHVSRLVFVVQDIADVLSNFIYSSLIFSSSDAHQHLEHIVSYRTRTRYHLLKCE